MPGGAEKRWMLWLRDLVRAEWAMDAPAPSPRGVGVRDGYCGSASSWEQSARYGPDALTPSPLGLGVRDGGPMPPPAKTMRNDSAP